MRRRDVLVLAASLVSTSAVAQGRRYRIAIVHPSAATAEMSEAGSLHYRTLFSELRHHGFVEGKNLMVERRSGGSFSDKYPELAREVVSLNPDLIYSYSRRLVEHIKAATTTIPVVAITSDPVIAGLVQNLARPGGNITGVSTDVGHENVEKRLELLQQAAPLIRRAAYLAPLVSWEGPYGSRLHRAGERLGFEVVAAVLGAAINPDEYERAFETMRAGGVDSVIVGQQQENVTHRQLIADLAARHRLPAVYPYREFAEAGGLLAYSVDQIELWRAAGTYIARVLAGEHPSQLPIHRPSRFELIINKTAADRLGLSIPPTLLARADEVIE